LVENLGEEKKKLISVLLAKGILIKPATLMQLSEQEIGVARSVLEQKRISSEEELLSEIKKNSPHHEKKAEVKIVKSYPADSKKIDVIDFVQYFNGRYRALSALIQNRQDVQNLTSIGRLKQKTERETVSIIGMIKDIQVTKNNNIILVLEDTTGEIKAMVSKNNPELWTEARSITPDEVVSVTGTLGQSFIYINNIIWPDVPFTKELKKADEEVYAIFLSDIHVGSNNFLSENFEKFIKWLRGEIGSEAQRDITRKIKYAFFIGDLVDGVGIYPDQDLELVIPDIYEQYEKCAEYLSRIPGHITKIICPGNHDAQRISEPQPPLSKEIAKPFYELKNTILVSNPAYINIHSSENFSGFDVLMYHGYSFDHYVANIDSIRAEGGYNKIDVLMKFLLKRRHLAPTHSSTLYTPLPIDPLFIDKVPDFFVTGHIHKTAVSSYRSTTLICGSCWQSKTSFQEKVGHEPEPARVPLVNLMTREVKILRF
jgi:DNA polymerase II small subunit